MTLAEKYGIQGTNKVQEINLNENPYKFDGTFKEVYDLVAAGRIKTLKQGSQIIGISVSGYDSIEKDNLAGAAFAKAYSPFKALDYFELASQLVEANLIPKIVSENPLRVQILNGRVTLDRYGDEVELTPEVEDDEPVQENQNDDTEAYVVPDNVVGVEKNIRNYIRKTEKKCLARGCEITLKHVPQAEVYEVRGIKWGRNLTQAEADEITVLYE